MEFLINYEARYGECRYIQYDRRGIKTKVRACNVFEFEDTQIICIRKTTPTTRLAQILGQHLVVIEKTATTMEAQGLTIDNTTISVHIGDMAKTLSKQQKRNGLVWSIEVMTVVNSWTTSLTFEMLRIIASSVRDIDTRLKIVEEKTLSRDPLPG